MLNKKFSSFLTDKSKKLYLKQVWSTEEDDENYLEVTVTDCVNYWTRIFNKSEVEKNSNLSNFDLESVRSQFEIAFLLKSQYNFLIQIEIEAEYLKLKLKKILESEIKVEVIWLKLDIVEDPTEKIGDIFDFTIDYTDELEAQLQKVNEENARLALERTEALSELDKCIKLKDSIENELYSKFTCILNEKKKKIRSLNNQINND